MKKTLQFISLLFTFGFGVFAVCSTLDFLSWLFFGQPFSWWLLVACVSSFFISGGFTWLADNTDSREPLIYERDK